MKDSMEFVLEVTDNSPRGGHLITENELNVYCGMNKYRKYIKQINKVFIIELNINELVRFLEEFEAIICQDDTAFIPEVYYSILV